MDDKPFRFDVEPTTGNHFAWLRTRMALERTFMAGVRTSVALIGFGFTIVKFFQQLQDSLPSTNRLHPEAPRDLGLALIAAGLITLAVFMWQFRVSEAYLWSAPYKPLAGMTDKPLRTPTFGVAFVVMVVGLVALVSVFIRF